MTKEEKKNDRISCCPTTKQKLKKYYVNNEFENYDQAINYLLDNIKKIPSKKKKKENEPKNKNL